MCTRGITWALTAAAIATALSACGTRPAYRDEAFGRDTPFSRRILGAEEIVCGSVRRALLNQGFVQEQATEAGVLNFTKAFQRDEHILTLRVHTTCMDNLDGSHTVFASALEETGELQTLKQPLGISIGPIGGITLPSGSARIPVTVRRETVQDADFYARLFRQVEELAARARRP